MVPRFSFSPYRRLLLLLLLLLLDLLLAVKRPLLPLRY
jgi:hypothetical protein